MVDKLILNQKKKQKRAHLSESMDIYNKFFNSCHNTRIPNSKAFKNDNLFMKNKLDIVLREHNGKSKFSIEGKVKKKKKGN